MKKTIPFLLCAIFMIILLESCATLSSGWPEEPDPFPTEKMYAVEFPEMIIIGQGGGERLVKILSLQRRTLTVLPFPYWSVMAEEISVDEIQILKHKPYTRPLLIWTIGAAEIGYLLIGSIMGAVAQVEYQYDLASIIGFLSGVGTGGVFLLTGGMDIVDSIYPEYFLPLMSEKRLAKTIERIMGVQ